MNLDSIDVERLLDQVAAGDPDAMETLLRSQRGRLRRMISIRMDRRIAQRVDPSDVVQDVLAKAAAQLPAYVRVQPIPFYPWLRRIAWQQLVDLHRRHLTSQKRTVLREQQLQLNEQSTAQLVTHLVAVQSSPSARAIRQELVQRVKEGLATLDDIDREILMLKYLEQLSSSEIAVVLDASPRTVQHRHRRAIEKMHELLIQAPSGNASR